MKTNAPRSALFVTLMHAVLLVGCSSSSAPSSTGSAPSMTNTATTPGRLPQARQMLDLTDFALPEGAELAAPATVAALRFTTDGPISASFERVRATLDAAGWQLHDDAQVSESSASALLSKDGWALSLTVMPQPPRDRTLVALQHHGNMPPSTLPKPAGASAVYEGPHAAVYRVPGSSQQVAQAMREALLADAWEYYGAGDGQVAHYRRHAIRLSVRSNPAPGQSDLSMLSLNAELLSAEIPNLPGIEDLQLDLPAQSLRFAYEGTVAELIEAYDFVARAEGWTRSLETPSRIEGKLVMTWRNTERDMLRVDYAEPRRGQQNVILSYQSRRQIDDMNRRLDAQAEAYKAARSQ